MYKRITDQAELSLVTVDEVKRQCRVFHNMEDVYLGSLIIPYSEQVLETVSIMGRLWKGSD